MTSIWGLYQFSDQSCEVMLSDMLGPVAISLSTWT